MFSAFSPLPPLRLHSAFPLALRSQSRNLYLALRKTGCMALVLWFATVAAQAQLFSVIAAFSGQNGSGPEAMSLVQGPDGNYLGTTSRGGRTDSGTVFRMAPGGHITVIYNFCLQPNCTDGDFPFAGLVLAPDGNFYGMTAYGGGNNKGMIYKVTPSGTLTVLHSFNTTDGATPESTLILVATAPCTVRPSPAEPTTTARFSVSLSLER